MRKLAIPLICLVFLIILGLGAYDWWIENTKPPSSDSSLKSFLITKGTSASAIGEKLYKEGLIKNPLAFKIYLQVTGKAEKIPAGEYRLPVNLSLYELVGQLIKGPSEIWVTIPEGLRREEVAEKYIQAFELKGEDAENFSSEFLSLTKNGEGYLFPDTYLFPRTASGSMVVKKMLAIFDTWVDEDIKSSISRSGYTLNQIVILASILERETKTDEERPIVAGIFLKRLKAGWPFQADATIQYTVANENCKPASPAGGLKIENCRWWEPLTKEDLETKSSYNTYKFAGLPPTPIANPGLSSIKALIYPQDSPYWFYIHGSSGQIHYAKTLEEHNKNINAFLGK